MTVKIPWYFFLIAFIVWTGASIYTGYYLEKKSIKVIPSHSETFSGKPDSSKIIPKVDTQKVIIKYISKPDSSKPAIPSTTPQILPSIGVDSTISHDTTECISYKTFTDSLYTYFLEIYAKSKVDSLKMSLVALPQKLPEIVNKWTWFEWGAGVGAVCIIVAEYIFTHVFK
jgi:hypothetical protein